MRLKGKTRRNADPSRNANNPSQPVIVSTDSVDSLQSVSTRKKQKKSSSQVTKVDPASSSHQEASKNEVQIGFYLVPADGERFGDYSTVKVPINCALSDVVNAIHEETEIDANHFKFEIYASYRSLTNKEMKQSKKKEATEALIYKTLASKISILDNTRLPVSELGDAGKEKCPLFIKVIPINEEKLIYYQLMEQNGATNGVAGTVRMTIDKLVSDLLNEIILVNEKVPSLTGITQRHLIPLKSDIGREEFNLNDTIEYVLGHCGVAQINPVMVFIDRGGVPIDSQPTFAFVKKEESLSSMPQVQLKLDDGSLIAIPSENLLTMEALHSFVSQHVSHSNYLYEVVPSQISLTGEIKVHLLTPPRHNAIIVGLAQRLSPKVERKDNPATRSNPSTGKEASFSRSFPELYNLIHNTLNNTDLDKLGKVCFVDAKDVLKSELVNADAPKIPVYYDGARDYIDFTFLTKETPELIRLTEAIKEQKQFLIMLRAVSGAGKTSNMMAYGMGQRVMYVEILNTGICSFLDEDLYEIPNGKLRFRILKRRLNAWILARLCILLYLEEHFNFEFADLMAVQKSNAFNVLVTRVYKIFAKLKVEETLCDVLGAFPTPLFVDECHNFYISAEFSYPDVGIINQPENQSPSSLSLLWLALSGSTCSIMLATTELRVNVNTSLISMIGKAKRASDILVEEFREFTFHEQPSLLLSYVKDFSKYWSLRFSGRARLGTNVLQRIIENQHLLESDNLTLKEFYEICSFEVFDFHAFGVTVENSRILCHAPLRSIHGKLDEYLSEKSVYRTDRDDISLRGTLVDLMINSVFKRENPAMKDEVLLSYISSGIGFLERVEPHSSLSLTLREPVVVEAMSHLLGLECIRDKLANRLNEVNSMIGPTEPMKGIIFQWLIQFSMLLFNDRTIGQVLSLWTGESEATLLKNIAASSKVREALIKDIFDISWQCDGIESCRTQYDRIFEKLKEKRHILYVVANAARVECILMLAEKIALTFGMKMLSTVRTTSFEENKSAGTLARMYLRHDGRILTRCESSRAEAVRFIEGNVSFNISIIFTLPDANQQRRYEVERVKVENDELVTLYIYIDMDNLSTLVGPKIARIISSFY